ncbi:hypothetical protein [Actinopolymorpha pittospori]|uniref:Uncharacterized protein n=1 Tax=Actinopolymorpha pittospori TaxID=648752 RepID=A0A927RI45_9ACTN|nr:hypothetical protein [Actinopolymorpha pittospori]MBE1612900.1 hypothetical protein [Actinopolymorpha pittospori]
MVLWIVVGVVILGVALVAAGRWGAANALPRRKRRRQDDKIPGVGERPGDQFGAGWPGGPPSS